MTAPKMKIKKGDTVVVITGKDKGRSGEVTKVIPDEARVVVSGINQMTKHRKPTQFAPGGIDKVEASIHVSNVAIADPKGGKASRVGYKVEKDGTKKRIARKSGETIG